MIVERINGQLFCKLLAESKKFGEMWADQQLSEECKAIVRGIDLFLDDPDIDLPMIASMFIELGAKTCGEFSYLCNGVAKTILEINDSVQVVDTDDKVRYE